MQHIRANGVGIGRVVITGSYRSLARGVLGDLLCVERLGASCYAETLLIDAVLNEVVNPFGSLHDQFEVPPLS